MPKVEGPRTNQSYLRVAVLVLKICRSVDHDHRELAPTPDRRTGPTLPCRIFRNIQRVSLLQASQPRCIFLHETHLQGADIDLGSRVIYTKYGIPVAA
jgi:hypothetical protein